VSSITAAKPAPPAVVLEVGEENLMRISKPIGRMLHLLQELASSTRPVRGAYVVVAASRVGAACVVTIARSR